MCPSNVQLMPNVILPLDVKSVISNFSLMLGFYEHDEASSSSYDANKYFQ